ncbi:MAG: J domain-containing protein [Deltaproteobacteria bacterium]|nr:J domain-containing protein [Deltaproteobacteria bacterium]
MILDPFAVLGLAPDAGDEAIRSRYLELVRRHPPDRDPQRFVLIREAYELISDEDCRIKFGLFRVVRDPDLKANLEAVEWKTEKKRPSSQELLARLRPKK